MTQEPEPIEEEPVPESYCPFISTVFVVQDENGNMQPQRLDAKCAREKCGVWDTAGNQCGLLSLVDIAAQAVYPDEDEDDDGGTEVPDEPDAPPEDEGEDTDEVADDAPEPQESERPELVEAS